MHWPLRKRAHPPQPSSSVACAHFPHDDSDAHCAHLSSSQNTSTSTNCASSSASYYAFADTSTGMRVVPFPPSSYQHPPRIAAPDRIPGCVSAPATPRTPRTYLPAHDSALPLTASSRPRPRLPMPVSHAQATLDALPVVDMEADRLARACGLIPPSVHWTERSSSPRLARPVPDQATSLEPEAGLNTSFDPAGSSAGSLRPRARSVRIPQRTPASQRHRTSSRPRSASQPASIPVFCPSSPRPVLRSLREILEEDGVQLDACLDVQHVVERWRRAANYERGLGLEQDAGSQRQRLGEAAPSIKTFGAPVGVAVKCGSMATAMGGFQHPIPWVVFACVEELNRTGIYQPGLFRSVPHRTRLSRLVESFDLQLPLTASPSPLPSSSTTPEEFPVSPCPPVHPTPSTTRASLRTESMADICALLKTYLTDLPEPLLDENLTVALYQFCVHPTIVRERLESEAACTQAQDHDMADDEYFGAHHPDAHAEAEAHLLRVPPAPAPAPAPPSAPSFSLPPALLTPSEQRTALLRAESSQILIAQHLLRLAPPPLCALFAYLLGFFTQLPLSPDNGMTLEDVARMFGRVLAGDSTASRRHDVLMWLLERWARVSEGLFDVANGDDDLADEPDPPAPPLPPHSEFTLFPPPVPRAFPPLSLSAENLTVAQVAAATGTFCRPHSASVSSCQSDGAASVASTSTGESVRTPGTEPTALFAVSEAEAETEGEPHPHLDADEQWVSYASARDRDGDVDMDMGAPCAAHPSHSHSDSLGPLFGAHDHDHDRPPVPSMCVYEVAPPEAAYAHAHAYEYGYGYGYARYALDQSSYHHSSMHDAYDSSDADGIRDSRSWPVSPHMKAGGGAGPFALPSCPGSNLWGLQLCGREALGDRDADMDMDVAPNGHAGR